MPIPLPRLDDRSFADLMREAEEVVRRRCPAWTDLSPGDPGTTLLEAFAYITDVLLYRVNRIPERVHVALLNLVGAAPLAPAAAVARLVFTRVPGVEGEMRVPAGARVADPTGSVTFTLLEEVLLPAGTAEAAGLALHAEPVEAELLGLGTGLPGQGFRVRQPPLLRGTEGMARVQVGVEADPAAPAPSETRDVGGRAFAIWREVADFLAPEAQQGAHVLDRASGLVTFGPASVPGAIPPRGREVRAWYWRGGGRAGNVGPGSLTVLRQPALPGLTVTNPVRAAGGEDGETTEQALRRAREAIGVLRTAVTARDFERAALESGGIARARAAALRDRWPFAEPGVVELGVVPWLPEEGPATPARLAAHQTPELLARVEAELAARRPLGVRTQARWTRCRPISVAARVVVARGAEPEAVRSRLEARIDRLLAPGGTWPHGRTLRASDVYEALLADPDVRYAEQLRFAIEPGPETAILHMARDPALPRTIHAATEGGLFRSLDAGATWTREGEGLPAGERVVLVRPDPDTAGLLAAVTEAVEGGVWSVFLSRDAGERFTLRDRLQNEEVQDIAWLRRDGRPMLLLATGHGLRRLDVAGEAGSADLGRLLRPGEAQTAPDGFLALAAMRHPAGPSFVAAAGHQRGGVLLSQQGAEPGSFTLIPGSVGQDVGTLAFQRDGDRIFLWAGLTVVGREREEGVGGVLRIEARSDGLDPAGWAQAGAGWRGGTCNALDFTGSLAAAATRWAGVLLLDLAAPPAARVWRSPPLDCGLPINAERSALVRTRAVAALDEEGAGRKLLLAGTDAGVFASEDAEGLRYRAVGASRLAEQVPLPADWLFCSGVHELLVQREFETE